MTFDLNHLSRRKALATGAMALGLAAAGLPRLAAAGYRETAVDKGGRVSGFLAFKGTPPKADEVLISKDNHHCGEGVIVPDPLRIGADGQVADAVVALKGITEGKPWADAVKTPKVVQARCRFQPFVQIAPKGAELTILNEDPLLHNIHAYEIIGRARRTLFNIAQPQAGQIDRHALKLRRGSVVELDCDAHNWMSAWIYTSEHPYAVVGNDEGRFVLEDIPPGDYEVIAWHPVLGEVSRKLAIAPGETAALDLEFTA